MSRATLHALGLVAALVAGATLGAGTVSAAPVIEPYEFASPALEQRYRELVAELRCPKCLNTNLAGSDAPIAADLRREVYRLLVDGASDDEIRAHLQARYGDFVLYDPPFRLDTLVLWAAPVLLLLLAALVLIRLLLRRPPANDVLTGEERSRLDSLVGDAGAKR